MNDPKQLLKHAYEENLLLSQETSSAAAAGLASLYVCERPEVAARGRFSGVDDVTMPINTSFVYTRPVMKHPALFLDSESLTNETIRMKVGG